MAHHTNLGKPAVQDTWIALEFIKKMSSTYQVVVLAWRLPIPCGHHQRPTGVPIAGVLPPTRNHGAEHTVTDMAWFIVVVHFTCLRKMLLYFLNQSMILTSLEITPTSTSFKYGGYINWMLTPHPVTIAFLPS